MTTYAIYVAKTPQGRENLEAGISARTWGLNQESIAEKVHVPGDPRTARDFLSAMKLDDLVLFGYAGPARAKPGEWADATLARGQLCRVTRTYYEDTSEVWQNQVYQHRFGFEPLRALTPLTARNVGIDVLEALRVSMISRSMPVASETALELVDAIAEPADLEGETDVLRWVLARREQAKLRDNLLGSKTQAKCAVCGEMLDKEHLWVAHIKRRADSNETERRDHNNVMLACLFGCDSLFEKGYIFIDGAGFVVANPAMAGTPATQAKVQRLVGARCRSHTSASAGFFAWHHAHLPQRGSIASLSPPEG